MYNKDIATKYFNLENRLSIDYDFLVGIGKFEDMLYLCPFVERTIAELLDIKGINNERTSQGTIKTMGSLLEMCELNDVLEKEELLFLKEIYREEGIRNKLFHGRINEVILDEQTIDTMKKTANTICNNYEKTHSYYLNSRNHRIEKI